MSRIVITLLCLAAASDPAASNPAERVERLVAALGSDDAKTREEADLELERTCFTSTRPEASSEGRAVATALAKALESHDLSSSAKQRIVRLLGYVGSYESVRPVAKLLRGPNPDLRDAALHALESNPTVPAVRALVTSLADAEGDMRIALIQSLGRRRYSLAVGPIMEVARTSKGALRLAALRALAEIGARSSLDVLVKTLDGSTDAERDELLEIYVRYAYRLKEESDGGAARRIFIDIVKYGGRWRIAGLIGIGRTGIPIEVPTVVEALGDDDPGVRAAAVQALATLRGGLKALLTRLPGASPDLKAQLLDALGRRQDAGRSNVVAAIVASSNGNDVGVKKAAIAALRRLGGAESIRQLLVELDAPNETIRGEAARALTDPKVVGAGDLVAEALQTASGPGKKALLVGILGWRGERLDVVRAATVDALPKIRRAAYRALGHTTSDAGESRKILVVAIDRETGMTREVALAALASFNDAETTAVLVRLAESESIPNTTRAGIIARLGDRASHPEVFTMLVRAGESADPTRSLAGIAALADSVDCAALPVLLDAARTKSGATKDAAVRGCVRLASVLAAKEKDGAAAVYLELLNLELDAKTKRQCLRGLGRLGIEINETK